MVAVASFDDFGDAVADKILSELIGECCDFMEFAETELQKEIARVLNELCPEATDELREAMDAICDMDDDDDKREGLEEVGVDVFSVNFESAQEKEW